MVSWHAKLVFTSEKPFRLVAGCHKKQCLVGITVSELTDDHKLLSEPVVLLTSSGYFNLGGGRGEKLD